MKYKPEIRMYKKNIILLIILWLGATNANAIESYRRMEPTAKGLVSRRNFFLILVLYHK